MKSWSDILEKGISSFASGILDNFIAILAVIFSALAVYIAIQTLDFNKRSVIVKDSFDPLLTELKKNRLVALGNRSLFHRTFIQDLKESYVFEAFEKKERRKIDSIIEKSYYINLFKQEADNKAEEAIKEVLFDELPEYNVKGYTLKDVLVQYENQDYYYFVINKTIEEELITLRLTVYCQVTAEDKDYNDCDEVVEVTRDLQSIPLRGYLYKTTDSSNYPDNQPWDPLDMFIDNKKIDIKILERFKSNTDFENVEIEYNSLMNDINELYFLINERVKKILISNYKNKK
ncbi:hypothetical protein [Halobacillus sp. Cin3]|uniref:hypothetical protein n=1 Tax=Halobacillus sp. Cin3 TaxID=2928441 RepID=UPI00248E86F4|nr:hypothetical protein [Halobacillus sp. Cin3]